MDSRVCNYDCSKRRTSVTSDPDISGVGISLAYTITAGLALYIVILFYLCAYRPDASPFERDKKVGETEGDQVLKPNPIDEYLLFWRLKPARSDEYISPATSLKADQIRTALTNCMLIISDLQLLTGLSIMMSGFSQLPCGISTYHWRRIIQLAWFSSVSHLCCLTFLRDYFYRNKTAQLWRIPSMVILVIMLIYATATTTQYAWQAFKWTGDENLSEWWATTDLPTPYDQAICFLRPSGRIIHESSGASELEKAKIIAASVISQQRVVISAVLSGVAMFYRLGSLYRAPNSIFLRLRRWASGKTRYILWATYAKGSYFSVLACASAIIIYRPLLAAFLTVRVFLDTATSKAFEVFWLTISFIWGCLNLWWRGRVHEPESQQWTFGQIIVVVLLVVPIISLVEGYFSGTSNKTNEAPETPHLNLPQYTAPSHLNITYSQAESGSTYRESPDYDFDNHCYSFVPVVYANLVGILVSGIMITISEAAPSGLVTNIVLHPENNLGMGFAYICFLPSLVMWKRAPESLAKRVAVRSLIFVGSCAMTWFPWFIHFPYSYMACGYFLLYLVMAVRSEIQMRRCEIW